MSEANPWKFNKETYWDRRKKGMSGQVPAPGSKKHQYEARRLGRQLHAAEMAKLQKGKSDERKNRKSTSKIV